MTRKGIRSSVAALALASALATPWAVQAAHLGYPDISEGEWYVDEGVVDWSEEHGVIGGFADGTWQPNTTVDRGQAAQILYNYSGAEAPDEPADFADADTFAWAADGIAWAQDEGVFNGNVQADGSATMDPWEPLSREQAATILCNMFGEPGDPAALDAFPDGGEVSAWACETVAWGVEHGVLGNAGEINPRDTCTRAEFVAMLKNVVAGSEGHEPVVSPGEGKQWVWVEDFKTVEVPVYETQWIESTGLPVSLTNSTTYWWCRACGRETWCLKTNSAVGSSASVPYLYANMSEVNPSDWPQYRFTDSATLSDNPNYHLSMPGYWLVTRGDKTAWYDDTSFTLDEINGEESYLPINQGEKLCKQHVYGSYRVKCVYCDEVIEAPCGDGVDGHAMSRARELMDEHILSAHPGEDTGKNDPDLSGYVCADGNLYSRSQARQDMLDWYEQTGLPGIPATSSAPWSYSIETDAACKVSLEGEPGHYEEVQVGTRTEQVSAGGHWEAR